MILPFSIFGFPTAWSMQHLSSQSVVDESAHGERREGMMLYCASPIHRSSENSMPSARSEKRWAGSGPLHSAA